MGVEPNFSLLNGGGVQNALAQGYQLGQHARQRHEEQQYRNALAQYDPANPETLKPIMAIDPRTGLELRQQQAQAAQAAQQQRRNDLPIMDRLLSQVAPDGSNWQQLLGVAQRNGIDISGVPQNFDPQWVKDTHALVQAAQTPQGQQALSTAGRQAVDMGFKPGTPEFNQVVHDIYIAGESKPYVVGGETRLYTPKIGGPGRAMGGPQPGTIEDGYRFKGGNPADPNSWEPVNGGPTQPASGGFHPVGLAGERVTSTLRSAAHNKAVGGVANSYHLTGRARDSVPPAGMSMNAYAAELRRLNPGLQVINEGDHIHIEPRG